MKQQSASQGTAPATYKIWQADDWLDIEGQIIVETSITIYVNGEELAGFSCTPNQLDHLAVGFLLNEGLVDAVEQVAEVQLTHGGTCVDVWLTHDIELPERGIFTSGCGRGVSFSQALDSGSHPAFQRLPEFRVTPDRLFELMRHLSLAATLYERAGGVHTSALSDGEKLIAVAEDVGRHNTLDKLRGWAALNQVSVDQGVLLTSGRISSEMLNKAAQMGVPVVVSRSSATSRAVEMAQARGITLVGYARPPRLAVYTWPERIWLNEKGRS